MMTLTLFGSVIGFWILISLFLLSCILSEADKDGTISFGAFVIGLGIFYAFGNINPHTIITFADVGYYLGMGLIYSIIRTFFRGFNNDGSSYDKLSDHVLRWILMWPISFGFWFFGDLITTLFKFLWKFVGKAFDAIEGLGNKVGGHNKTKQPNE